MRDNRRNQMGYIDNGNEQQLAYTGSRFTITAHDDNELEVKIIRLFNENTLFQTALEFREKSTRFHPGEGAIVGVHTQEILEYCDKMSARYPSWRNDWRLRSALMIHDLGKKWEYDFPRKRSHQKLSAESTEILGEIGDETIRKLVEHHDDYYKLYAGRAHTNYRMIFIATYHGMSQSLMETLIRLEYADTYRLAEYTPLMRDMRSEVEWHVGECQKMGLVNQNFKVFS